MTKLSIYPTLSRVFSRRAARSSAHARAIGSRRVTGERFRGPMDQLGITVFDVAVIAVAIFGAAIGWSSGFAHAVLFIGSWIGAGYVALNYSKLIQPEVEKLLNGNTELATFASMLVVFVAALIVLVMLTNTLSRSIKASPLRRPTPSWAADLA